MRIILLAETAQKKELVPKEEDVTAELAWSTAIDSLRIEKKADACIDLLFDDAPERINKLRQLRTEIIVINAVSLNDQPGVIRINGWNTFLNGPVIEASGDERLRKKAEDVFSLLNKKIEWVNDMDGFIVPRVIASIINEAYFTLEQQVSTREEIDTAMKLGTNYPYGPFEWSQKIGLKKIYSLLKSLSRNQKRYEPATLLAKEATG